MRVVADDVVQVRPCALRVVLDLLQEVQIADEVVGIHLLDGHERRLVALPVAPGVALVPANARQAARAHGAPRARVLGRGERAHGARRVGILIIFFMGRPAIKALKDYEEQQRNGVTDFTFDPKKLGIKNAEFWEKKHDNKDK